MLLSITFLQMHGGMVSIIMKYLLCVWSSLANALFVKLLANETKEHSNVYCLSSVHMYTMHALWSVSNLKDEKIQ